MICLRCKKNEIPAFEVTSFWVLEFCDRKFALSAVEIVPGFNQKQKQPFLYHCMSHQARASASPLCLSLR